MQMTWTSNIPFVHTVCAACLLFSALSSDLVGQTISSVDPRNSSLPKGTGFSSQYASFNDLENDDRVIFADDFEAGDYRQKWDSSNKGSLLSLVDDSASNSKVGQRSLRAGADSSTYGGSGLIKWFPSADSIFVRFDVKFEKDSRGFWHLVRLAGNKGLTGNDKWSSFGQAGKVPNGTDWFATGIEPASNNFGTANSLGKWTSYTYWPEMTGNWGKLFTVDSPPPIETDKWISVELMLKHNTPGERDGEQAFWINGELVGHWTGYMWRTSPTLWANALVLETYLEGRFANPRNTALFDNVVVASEYIGPSGVAIPEPNAMQFCPLIILGASFLRRPVLTVQKRCRL